MHVHLGARDVDVAAQHQLAALGVQAPDPGDQALHEAQLRRIVLAAVRYVDRREHGVAHLRRDDARLHVELGMRERRCRRADLGADVQRHARVGAHAMPVHVVLGQLARLGNLYGLCLQLLQADDIGLVARQPVAELRCARPNAVDVPGRDLHKNDSGTELGSGPE